MEEVKVQDIYFKQLEYSQETASWCHKECSQHVAQSAGARQKDEMLCLFPSNKTTSLFIPGVTDA